MKANHLHFTTQKSFYIEISRARDRAQLEAATGERIAALEGIGEMPREARDNAIEAPRQARGRRPNRWLRNGNSRQAWTSGCDRMARGRRGPIPVPGA